MCKGSRDCIHATSPGSLVKKAPGLRDSMKKDLGDVELGAAADRGAAAPPLADAPISAPALAVLLPQERTTALALDKKDLAMCRLAQAIASHLQFLQRSDYDLQCEMGTQVSQSTVEHKPFLRDPEMVDQRRA